MPKPVAFFAFSNDNDDHLAHLKEESRRIRESFRKVENRIFLEREESATTKDVFNTFYNYRGQIAIFHYAGHSEGSLLKMEEMDAKGITLAQFIRNQAREQLQLVFLNGCATEDLVLEFYKAGVNAIIATIAPVGDPKAMEFSDAFYKALVNGSTLKEAFDSGEAVINIGSNQNKRETHIVRGLDLGNNPSEEIPWRLYYQEENEAILNWTLRDANIEFSRYYKEIQSYYHQPALGDEKIRLSDIYIEPNFKIHKRNLIKKNRLKTQTIDGFISLDEFSEYSIHDYIKLRFLEGEENPDIPAEQSRILLLLGQPGQGKTSFCYRFINDFLKNRNLNRELIFLKLKDLRSPREFIHNPKQEIESHFEELELSINNNLILLDGLDELFMTEGLTNIEISDFFRSLPLLVNHYNQIQLIITSRFHYIDLSKIGKEAALILSIAPLTMKQQNTWLDTYKKYYPSCLLSKSRLAEINDQSKEQFRSIRELSNQPILLHLIAKADFDIQENENRSKIYDRLFETLIDRTWEKDGQLEKFQIIDKQDFREYMGVIALKIYQSDHEYILGSELLSLEETKVFIEDNLIGDFKAIEDALKEILVNFYFKNVDPENLKDKGLKEKEYAIEFLHKSLQEFLAAECIWITIINKFTHKNERGKPIIREWKEAFKILWEKVSRKQLSSEVATYLIEIIFNDKWEKRKQT